MSTRCRFCEISAAALMATMAGRADDLVPPVRAHLLVGVERFVPGAPFDVGIRLAMPRNWHIYWRNPGDAGLATSLRWDLPEGFSASANEWPAPERFVDGDLASYGYAGEVVLPVRIRPPAQWPANRTAELRVRVDWLQCRDACVPGHAELARRMLPGAAAARSPEADAIDAARAQVPQRDPAVRAEAAIEHGRLRLKVHGLGTRRPRLFCPATEIPMPAATTPVWQQGAEGSWSALLPPATGRVEGVLLLTEGRAIELDFEVDRASFPVNGTPEDRR